MGGQDMMDRNMGGQERRSDMRDMQRPNQAFTPNQYMVKDDFGNYAYSYNGQESEKSEERNGQSIKGQYTYIMANGVKRQVEYIADNNGFHIIRDNADPARIKRSTEPDLLQARMTSMMDSSSLRDDARDMYRMSNVMGRDMPSKMDRNLMGMDQQRYSNMRGRDSLNRNMMGQDTMEHNMMGQDIMGRKMMGQDTMGRNMMGQDIMGHNMMGQDTMGRNMMGQDSMERSMMSQDTMGRNMMGQDSMGHKMIGQDTMGLSMMGRNIYNIMSNRGMASDVSNMMGQQQMNSNVMGRDMTMMNRNMMGQDRNSV